MISNKAGGWSFCPAIYALWDNFVTDWGVVVLLHVIAIPDQLPLSAGRRFIEARKSLLQEATEMVEREDVPVETLIRISHRPAEAIIQTVTDHQVDLLIMGWRGQSRDVKKAIGQNSEQPTEAKPTARHEYDTVGYVIKGRAELQLEEQTILLEPGDSWLVPPSADHTYKILEPFTAVEVTSPPARIHARDETSA